MNPQRLVLNGFRSHEIWLVDDLWFEGSGQGTFPIRDLVRGFDQIDTLDVLLEALRIARQSRRSDFGLLYLDVIASLCLEYSFALVLCNFEYLDSHFYDANKRQAAVMVDVEYKGAASGKYSSDTYGIELLAARLHGYRPIADMFFFTAYPQRVRETIDAHWDDPTWWPLRFLPCVPKTAAFTFEAGQSFDDMMGRLRTELKGFVHYFAQGVSKEIVREFALALLEANQLGVDHPDSLDALPAAFLFGTAYMAEGRSGLESFKAMHHFDRRGPRTVSAAIFDSIFDTHRFKQRSPGLLCSALPTAPD